MVVRVLIPDFTGKTSPAIGVICDKFGVGGPITHANITWFADSLTQTGNPPVRDTNQCAAGFILIKHDLGFRIRMVVGAGSFRRFFNGDKIELL